MRTIKIYQSPDADDAFMMYGLDTGLVESDLLSFVIERRDIEALNQAAMSGSSEVTALSAHALGHVSDKYEMLPVGASFAGKDYGPRMVAATGLDILKDDLSIAIPGELTSAALAIKIFAARQNLNFRFSVVDFDLIPEAVKRGEYDAGVVIHESQLSHGEFGLSIVIDVGAWWWSEYDSPLPLGIIAVKRSLPQNERDEVLRCLTKSIEYALRDREAALQYAAPFSKGLRSQLLNQYIEMYVNDLTVDMGERGLQAIKLFLGEGRRFGIIDRKERGN